MPKMKTHRGTAKRIKVTGTGKYVAKHSGKSHILTKKTRKRKNRMKKDFVLLDNVHKSDMIRLLPYGVGR
ncbi:50S ribosomal protein L35 [Fusobacterium perfoetens]|uniref:50S ribosomal protein L35 n=1 Tax=Fusobacterium perfoetens TaxID=852 RepID=UPI000484608B|nr:50S ribosomal protein L35 [Fusobacterium perfoetens]MCI6152606.1 50S ribosomal protein L35 [Fusobacterium perfoetens]MDY3237613.1 50S ribosomal protein L35 [Fusobacterium perfoetens]